MEIFDFLKKKKDSIGALITNSDINCPQVKENLIEKSLTLYFEIGSHFDFTSDK